MDLRTLIGPQLCRLAAAKNIHISIDIYPLVVRYWAVRVLYLTFEEAFFVYSPPIHKVSLLIRKSLKPQQNAKIGCLH